jgi:DMSO reductase family type II enzyme chaperone
MTDTETAVRADLDRSGLHRLLALGFRYPETGSLAEFRRVQQLFGSEWPFPSLDPALLAFEVPDEASLTDEYLRLFDRKVACSPYESEYGMGNKAFTKSRDLADISGFYTAFGMALAESAGDLQDHIAVELEFMSVLALKAAYARNEGLQDELEVTLGAEAAFLRDHLGRWVPHFCDRLEETCEQPFYAHLARLTRAWLDRECRRLEVTPLPLGRQLGNLDGEDKGQGELICPMAVPKP